MKITIRVFKAIIVTVFTFIMVTPAWRNFLWFIMMKYRSHLEFGYLPVTGLYLYTTLTIETILAIAVGIYVYQRTSAS